MKAGMRAGILQALQLASLVIQILRLDPGNACRLSLTRRAIKAVIIDNDHHVFSSVNGIVRSFVILMREKSRTDLNVFSSCLVTLVVLVA